MDDIVDRLRNATALTRKDLLPLCSDALDEIERLRSLITSWADAEESVEDDYQFRSWDLLEWSEKELDEAKDALRKAVGR